MDTYKDQQELTPLREQYAPRYREATAGVRNGHEVVSQ
jgi:hypothetical protein